MPHIKSTALINAMLSRRKIAAIAEFFGTSENVIKQAMTNVYRHYKIPHVLQQRIAFSVMMHYRRRPELIPFNNGDRAEQVGQISAKDFAQIKMGKL